jgi:hypothetical protein
LLRFDGLLGSWWQEQSSGVFRKEAWMVGPSAVTRAGLDATLTQDSKGKWHVVLRDDSGAEVFSGGPYSSDVSAKASAGQWVRKHYQVEAEEVPARPQPKKKRASPFTGKAPSAGHLTRLLNLRADRNESQAIELRAKADALEMEAKRLREAADTLGGSGG